ncbi:hypothetical protein [Pseudaestuariivita sp.]|uniref:hypothetical protein n=1 Tax=Pseudaestuariivita sp. TaxID=2211669 RepID=UPI0040581EF7
MHAFDITISSPLGETPARITWDASSGEMRGKGGSGPMEALSHTGDALSFKVAIDRPMPMTMKFAGTIDGDAVSGTVKFGPIAKGTFAGTRAA